MPTTTAPIMSATVQVTHPIEYSSGTRSMTVACENSEPAVTGIDPDGSYQLLVMPGRWARISARRTPRAAAKVTAPTAFQTPPCGFPVRIAMAARAYATEKQPIKIARNGSTLRVSLDSKTTIQMQSAALTTAAIMHSVDRAVIAVGIEE